MVINDSLCTVEEKFRDRKVTDLLIETDVEG